MRFFYVNPQQNYLSTIANWLVQNYHNNLQQMRIFMANGLMCHFLNHYLCQQIQTIGNKKHFLLPTLIPINNIAGNIFAINQNNIAFKQASKLDQLCALAGAITSKEQIKLNDSLFLAKQLDRNFAELARYQVGIDEIKSDDFFNKSLYLQQQIQSLSASLKAMREVLTEDFKLPSYDFKALEHYTCDVPTIFIATTRVDAEFNAFIAEHLSNKTACFILPPIQINQISYFYDSANLLALLKIHPNNVTPLALTCDNYGAAIFDFNDANITYNSKKFAHISSIVCENITQEATLILLLIKDFLDSNKAGKVALISSNYYLVNLVARNLAKHGIDYTNFIGQRFLQTQLAQFLLNIANILLENDNIDKILILLKHPYLSQNNQHILELENLIRKHKFITNVGQITKYVELSDNKTFQLWWNNWLKPILEASINQHHYLTFQQLLEQTMLLAQNIYPQIWHLDHDPDTIEFLRELILSTKYLNTIDKAEFIEVLKTFFSEHTIKQSSAHSRVNLLSIENSLYLNFDLVILADMNQGSWPNMQTSELGLTNQLRSHLNLPTQEQILAEKFHDFFLLLNNKQVILTRAKKGINSINQSSICLQKLQHLAQKAGVILENKNHYLELAINYLNTTNPKLLKQKNLQNNFLVSKDAFPSSISATSIELLIRNPYGFFARNILKLYKQKDLSLDSINAEFGTILHSIICKFNSQQQPNYTTAKFLELAKAEFAQLELSNYLTKLWWPKICRIAQSYCNFNAARRKTISQIYSEIAGEMKLNFAQKVIKITAIADEIVLLDNADFEIIDYKTGAIPAISDAVCGIAPQLAIEGLILANGGFNIGQNAGNNCKQIMLSFVKLSSSGSAIEKTCITIPSLDAQLAGLYTLLQAYVEHDSIYSCLPDADYAPKYNDWRHLGRI